MDLSSNQSKSLITGAVVIVAIGLTVALYWPRADAITAALHSSITQQDTDHSLVAKAILDNYKEARSNAARWSGVYWGFTFLAAIFSALAGIILKVESIFKNNEQMKKDVAALLAVCAALLITISTSGDFQRKWQANRVAASELERAAYYFLENSKTKEPRKYLMVSRSGAFQQCSAEMFSDLWVSTLSYPSTVVRGTGFNSGMLR